MLILKNTYWALCLFFFGCTKQQIEVEHFFVDKKSLPSTFARSPDPEQDKEYLGQIFLIHYSLNDEGLKSQTPIVAQFLLEDLQEFTTEFVPNQKRGAKRMEWINDSYQKHGPIIGYRVCFKDFTVESPLFREMIEVDKKRLLFEKNPTNTPLEIQDDEIYNVEDISQG